MDMSANKAPTIIDVARESGLSKSVVSRALNGESGVSRTSRERVEKAAAGLGYVANTMARRMRSHQVDTLGVLVRDPSSVFYGSLLRALQEAASARDVRLISMTGTGRPDLEEERSALRSLLSLRVDGLLVCSGLLPANDLYPFADRVPTVVVGRGEWDSRIGSVSCDDEDGIRKILDHVQSTGWTDLLVPIAPARLAPSLHVRGNEIIAQAQSRGLSATPIPADGPGEAAARIRQVLKDRSAVVAPNDRWALTILEQIGDPRRALVTGYDGLGAYSSPLLGLVTLAQPVRELATCALDMVIGTLTEGAPPAHRTVPGALHVSAHTS